MGRTLRGLTALALCLGLASGLTAQDFALDLTVESTELSGEIDAVIDFTADLTLTSSNVDGDAGPQGWSLGVSNAGVDVTNVTWDGTVSADSDDGGLVDTGFQVAELIDPDLEGQGQGLVSAMVLSFVMPITLPPNTTQVILKADYAATVGAAPSVGTLAYTNGLRGSGQPVNNDITFMGQTFSPSLGSIEVNIVPPAQPEDCTNGVDDDGDGAVDCDDDDCAEFPACQPEVCDNGVDDNGDGMVDCDDAMCAEARVCQPEDCTNGVDDNDDGLTDCEDPVCAEDEVACPPPPPGGMNLVSDGPEAATIGTEFTLTLSICPADENDLPADGAQGWSIGYSHDESIVTGVGEPTTEGTDAGDLMDTGFEKSEFVDPTLNDQGGGLVSAVVLSFTMPIKLDPTQCQTILNATYTHVEGAADGATAVFAYVDGLQGAGQPVDTVLTVEGATVEPTMALGHTVRCEEEVVVVDPEFLRADANNDDRVDIADPIWTINMLVRSGPVSPCMDAADSNDDGTVDLSDAMYTIEHRFLGGPNPPAPFPDCGADGTEDELTCEDSSCP